MQFLNVPIIERTEEVLNKGTVVRLVHSENVDAMVVTLEVSNKGTVVRLVHW